MISKSILLTGGSGVIGRTLCERLINTHKIIGIGTDYSRIPEFIRHHKNFKFYERDFLKIQSVEDLQITEKIDIVIHLAGLVSGNNRSEEDYFKINADSTKLLLDFSFKNSCKAFALASSVSVLSGKSVYARSKLQAEKYCSEANLDTSIFRIASVYGNGTKSFVSKLYSLYKKGIYPFMKTEKPKSLIHIEDLVQVLVTWVEKVSKGESVLPVYVISHPQSVTIREVVGMFQGQNKGFRRLPIPVFNFAVSIFDQFYQFQRKLRKLPFHSSPLTPLLHSVEIYDAVSWNQLGIKPNWDLRKGISQYK